VNPPERPRRTWKDNIQMDVQEVGCGWGGGGERGLNRSGSG